MEVPLYIVLAAAVLVLLYVTIPALYGSPWWPAPVKKVVRLLGEAGLKEGETLIDLGCGDARILIEAVRKFGAIGIGVEIDPFKAAIARFFVRRAGLAEKIKIVRSSAADYPLHEADVVFLYLSHQLIDKLKPKFEKELGDGARIVSYGFMVQGFPLVKTDAEKKAFIYKMSLGKNVNRYT